MYGAALPRRRIPRGAHPTTASGRAHTGPRTTGAVPGRPHTAGRARPAQRPPRECRAPPREAAAALRCCSGSFRDHGAALQPAPVRVAASSALQARTGALLLRPRRAVRGQHGGQLQGGGVRRARTGPLRGPGLLRHAGPGAAHGAQLGRSVPATAGSVSARLGRPGRASAPSPCGDPGALPGRGRGRCGRRTGSAAGGGPGPGRPPCLSLSPFVRQFRAGGGPRLPERAGPGRSRVLLHRLPPPRVRSALPPLLFCLFGVFTFGLGVLFVFKARSGWSFQPIPQLFMSLLVYCFPWSVENETFPH